MPKLGAEIRAGHAAQRQRYGSPRVHARAAGRGRRVGRKRVARLMRQEGLVGAAKRRFRATTDSNHAHPDRAERARRETSTRRRPNRVWVTDMTYVWTGEGWLYLAAILDLFSRRVVGWATSEHLRPDAALDALWAWLSATRQPDAGLVHHSDRGCQYASDDYRAGSRTRHRLQHEPQGRLLGQRRRRELLRDAQGGAHRPRGLRERSRPLQSSTTSRLLQPSAPALLVGLRQPGGV